MRPIKGTVAKFFGVVLLAVVLGASRSSAIVTVTNLTNGGSISMSNLVTNAMSVQVGDKLFGNFSLLLGDSGLVASDVTLYGLTNQIGYGFQLQLDDFTVTGTASKDISLDFSVQVTDPSQRIVGDNLTINAGVSGYGLAAVTENVYSAEGIGSGLITTLFAERTASVVDLQDFVTFCQPMQLIWIEKDIQVNANPNKSFSSNPSGDVATLSIIDQVFTQVPEPSTLFLLASGIVGLVVIRRRR
ncbi:MAG TPA: PEP-CTERM sorting domain-containing protein [Verrucomicrobiae bacterium]|nr:PEP-CTERM sorting domain-containing protein [Verrucomicrobiae bacterium]